MTPTRDQELAVLRSVIYASLFEYPLTLPQLRASLVGVAADETTIHRWCRSSAFLRHAIECRDGLYFPRGKGDMVHTRARREELSRELLERNRSLLRFVAAMPFVRMVALSGSLAHLNAERSADLDLFVITAAGRVWSVTLAVLVVSRLMGWRKRLCLNYVISERQMAIEPDDLFSANQIIHLHPVTGHEVFARFVRANPFVATWYPNFEVPATEPAGGRRSAIQERLFSLAAAAAERAARGVYGWHLRRRSASWQSRDQVRLEPECLKLHTSSHRASILARFERAMEEFVAEADAHVKAKPLAS